MILYFDTKWDITKNEANWGVNMIESIFGNSVFSPMNLTIMFNNIWPSVKELIASGM